MKITFFYKGRYFLQDAVVTETLSAIAKRYGHATALVYDQDIFGLSDNIISSPALHWSFANPKNFVKKVMETDPDLLVFYDAIHLNRNWIRALLAGITQAGGCAKAVYLSCVETPDSEDFNFTLIGEPELTFDLFLRERQDLGSARVFRHPGVADLNGLPIPDKSLFDGYIDFKDSYLVFTSKGCPGRCSYCLETVLKDAMGAHYCRRRSPWHVLAELKAAKERYGIKEVIYKDSIFAINKDWLREYLPQYREQIALPFKCFAKAGSFDAEMARMLKESRCYCVEFGVQTFNESLKHNILAREEKNTAIQAAFAICDEYDLTYDADHLFGIPQESLEDHLTAAGIYAQLRRLNRIKCHNLVFYRHAKIFESSPVDIKNDSNYQADFFSSIAGSPDMRVINACFQKYFKILPLLSTAANAFVRNKHRWKFFKFVPDGLIMAGMLILAMKNRDKRFRVYLKQYPRMIIRMIRGV
ncbi:MAG TPA: hypothetical protein PLB05_00405 [Candidatus Omnitrophota bacterium]|nr:hypothetical protein [Candidatus Omnitrophota bacterium]